MHNSITGNQSVKSTHNILRLPEVLKRRGQSRSSHYADIHDELFVKPVRIGLRATGTPENEVNTIIAARIAGLSEDEVRALVKTLHSNRKTLASIGE